MLSDKFYKELDSIRAAASARLDAAHSRRIVENSDEAEDEYAKAFYEVNKIRSLSSLLFTMEDYGVFTKDEAMKLIGIFDDK